MAFEINQTSLETAAQSGRSYADQIGLAIKFAAEDRRDAILETAISKLRKIIVAMAPVWRTAGASDADIQRFDEAASDAFANRISDILLPPQP
jgi:hypothetical protein